MDGDRDDYAISGSPGNVWCNHRYHRSFLNACLGVVIMMLKRLSTVKIGIGGISVQVSPGTFNYHAGKHGRFASG